ncbi:MAG: carboxylesterase family protein, partial [Opitutae bacterium]|nr:carboxylesterase family protein [Opitutae bacterium]
MKPVSILSLFIFTLITSALGKTPYPPKLTDAREEVYKTIGDTKLKLWIFEPEGHKKSDKRPAVVFFFGGGWRAGTPGQFEMQCKYLASRGMVALTAHYRVSTRHGTKAAACVEDGKSAV